MVPDFTVSSLLATELFSVVISTHTYTHTHPLPTHTHNTHTGLTLPLCTPYHSPVAALGNQKDASSLGAHGMPR